MLEIAVFVWLTENCLSLILFFCRWKQGDFLHVKEMLGYIYLVYEQSCTYLHKWITWYKLDDVHIFGNQGIVDRDTQLKIFVSLFRTVVWGSYWYKEAGIVCFGLSMFVKKP